MIALSDAKPGLEYTVKWNMNHNEGANATARFDLRCGNRVYLLSSFFGNVVIEINGKRVALGRDTAFWIKV